MSQNKTVIHTNVASDGRLSVHLSEIEPSSPKVSVHASSSSYEATKTGAAESLARLVLNINLAHTHEGSFLMGPGYIAQMKELAKEILK